MSATTPLDTSKLDPRKTDPDAVARQIIGKLTYQIGKRPDEARKYDWLRATTLVVRDHVMDRWFASGDRIAESGAKEVCYLSMEFLIGRLLREL